MPPNRERPPGTFRYSKWRPPVSAPLRLLDAEFSVARRGAPQSGAPTASGSVEASGVIARFAGSEFEVVHDRDGELRWLSPLLPTESSAQQGPSSGSEEPAERAVAAEVRIALRPRGLRRFQLLPRTDVNAASEFDLRMRRLEVEIPEDLDAEAIAHFRVAVDASLRSNWQDEHRSPRLRRIELRIDEAPPGFRADALVEIAVLSERARFAASPAAVDRVERAGVVRPAFAVNAGAAVEIELDVPAGGANRTVDVASDPAGRPESDFAGGPESAPPWLRWHDSALRGAVRKISLTPPGGERVVLDRRQGPLAEWSAAAVPLARWAGQRVRLEFAVEGEGVAFFADPRIARATPPTESGAAVPDVLVVMVDTLRADRLGFWERGRRGERAAHSPAFDALALGGVVFARTFSASPWTKPSIATLMTGQLPTTHRVGARSYTDRLPEAVPVVQESFRRGGWRTASFAANPLGSTLSGLDRGFDLALPPAYWKGTLSALGSVGTDELQRAFEAWVDEEAARPFFAYLHAVEPHEYAKPRYVRAARSVEEAYGLAVQDFDRKLAALVSWIERRRAQSSRDVLLVLISDHGESFGDHGDAGHGTSLFQSQLHVPFVLWAGSALPPMTSDALVSTVDLAPTLLELVGLPAIDGTAGRSLVPLVDGRAGSVRESANAARLRFVWDAEGPQWHATIGSDARKVMLDGERMRIFDLAEDPCERSASLPDRRDESEFRRQQAEALAAGDDWRERFGSAERTAVGADELDALRALGYVE